MIIHPSAIDILIFPGILSYQLLGNTSSYNTILPSHIMSEWEDTIDLLSQSADNINSFQKSFLFPPKGSKLQYQQATENALKND